MSTSSTDIRGQAEESAKKLMMGSRTAVHSRVQRPRAGGGPAAWTRVSAGDGGAQRCLMG